MPRMLARATLQWAWAEGGGRGVLIVQKNACVCTAGQVPPYSAHPWVHIPHLLSVESKQSAPHTSRLIWELQALSTNAPCHCRWLELHFNEHGGYWELKNTCVCARQVRPYLTHPWGAHIPYLLSGESKQSAPHASRLVWELQDSSQYECIMLQPLARAAFQWAWGGVSIDQKCLLLHRSTSPTLLSSPMRSAHSISFISF